MEINQLDVNSVAAAAVAMNAPPRETGKPPHESADTAFSRKHAQEIAAAMQSQLERMNISLEFTTYGTHGDKFAVVVADKATGEVIREIPSRELQELYAKMDELTGMLLNRQA